MIVKCFYVNKLMYRTKRNSLLSQVVRNWTCIAKNQDYIAHLHYFAPSFSPTTSILNWPVNRTQTWVLETRSECEKTLEIQLMVLFIKATFHLVYWKPLNGYFDKQ